MLYKFICSKSVSFLLALFLFYPVKNIYFEKIVCQLLIDSLNDFSSNEESQRLKNFIDSMLQKFLVFILN